MTASNGVAVVTAASRGIGAACATELARRGYQLVVMSRSSQIDEFARSVDAIAVRGSVTDPLSLQRLVDVANERFGRIDVLVNNTGDPPGGDLLAIQDSTWHECLDLVLLSVIRLTRLVTPIMQAQRAGAIVNISAADAFEPDLRFPIAGTFRAALSAWTKLYARRYGELGIRVNCVLPGYTMPNRALLNEEGEKWWDVAEAEVPMRRPASYNEIAAAVGFLASPEASYITGQSIKVDGGLTRGF